MEHLLQVIRFVFLERPSMLLLVAAKLDPLCICSQCFPSQRHTAIRWECWGRVAMLYVLHLSRSLQLHVGVIIFREVQAGADVCLHTAVAPMSLLKRSLAAGIGMDQCHFTWRAADLIL